MKAFIVLTLLVSTPTFAQSLELKDLKALLTQKKAILEKVNPGMSKKTQTNYSVETDEGICKITQTSEQTILRIEGKRMIIHSKEVSTPQANDVCANAEIETYESTILYYEDVPTLQSDIEDLDAMAKDIKTIFKSNEAIMLGLTLSETDEDGEVRTATVNMRYDLTKPSFKNLVSSESQGYSFTSTDVADKDVNSFNLSQILFCENNDGDNTECMEGDFSDILF